MSNTQYYFLPSIRQGLAAAIKPSANGAHRAQLDVTLRATARVKGTTEMESAELDIKGVQLYGPGDIVGFDPRIIVRTDPKLDVGDFEPNYFPAIEFADADFAWRYTAENANGQTGRLMPWITLIVLVSEAQGDNMQPEFDEGSRSDQNLPPYIEVNTSVLPDLQHAWRWAHVHITGEETLSKDHLIELLRTEPERAVCRLLCPRRLAPKTHYTAFVVPTFKLGILAGHGCELDPAIGALKPAWGAGDNTSNCIIYDDQGRLRLPYYYRWDFQTGVRGDFEHLVRLLEPRKLSGLGIRDIDCEKPGFGTRGVNLKGVDDPNKHYLSMEGALKSVDTEYTQWGRDPADVPAQPPRPLQKDITNLINGLFCPFDIEEGDAINNIAVSAFAGGTSVQIAWHTPIPSTSHVDYGETIDYGHSKDDPDLKYDHQLTLTGLTSGITYHFKIVVRAREGTVAETSDGTFCIPELPSVVPPIYGRWHAARGRVNPHDQEAWLDVLNLDPRHRAAAGLGSQVIRKQQEPLMASAWEQLGAIESANDILRRAQFGRDSSNWLYQRLDHLATEDFLRVSGPVLKRVIVEEAESGEKMTAAQYLKTQSRIPAAALDPAFRRILRPRGPIRKRQGAGRSVNLLSRLASGEPVATGHPTGRSPKPLGTTRLCDITRQLLDNLPAVTISANPAEVKVGETSTLHWHASNCTSCRATGGPWHGTKICTGHEEVGPFDEPGEYTFYLMCEGLGGSVTASTTIRVKLALAPDVDINVDLPEVNVGVAVTLHWHASNCTSCMASGSRHWQGAKTCTGDEEVGPFEEPGEYTLHLTGEGPGGSVTASITILVMGVRAPTVSIFAWSDPLSPYFVFLKWSASNCTSCIDPFGGTICKVEMREAGVSPGENTFCMKCTAPEEVEKCVTITVRDDGSVVSVIRTFAGDRRVEDDPALRFCDGRITCYQIGEELGNHQPFADVEDIHDPLTTRRLICDALNDWLDKQPEGGIPEPPTQGPGFVDRVKEMVFPALDPNRTVVERTKKRLRLAGELAERFEEGAKGDPLDSIMWAPQFPQPMYEPLLDISHDLLLPGVEKIPQNTISLLETNRRFLESYMCGSNHEFAGELLWRGYPTDQRGSYFRQFWDVSEYVSRDDKLQQLLIGWLRKQGLTSIQDLATKEKRRIIRRHQDEVGDISNLSEDEINDLVAQLVKEEQLAEMLKDITPLVKWQNNRLGYNKNRPGEDLVLVVRGDLLKRYPNALIYAIDAVSCDGAEGEPVPGLPEYLKDSNGDHIRRIFPVFQATLPPDLTFFGFPFSEEDARGFGGGLGKYFVIEEQVLEPRFGLDVTTDELLSWDDLSWTHFGLQEAFGSYLDENTIEEQPEDNSGKEWNDADTPGKPASSSATRAWITLQKPVRIAMHAKQMLPQSAYFEFKGPDPNDRFVIKLVDPEKIEHARKILRGAETGRTHIAGVIALEKASYNHPDWSYHMKPDSIEFFDEAKEVCDATMRYVEEHLDEVGGAFLPGNRWCPWGSELTSELKDMGE